MRSGINVPLMLRDWPGASRQQPDGADLGSVLTADQGLQSRSDSHSRAAKPPNVGERQRLALEK